MTPEPTPPPMSTLAESQHKATHKQTVKSGRGYILAIGIIQLIVGIVICLAGAADKSGPNGRVLFGTGTTVAVLGAIYIGLWIWAKRAPFAAALVALVLYVSVLALDAVMAPEQIGRGIIIKILIILALSQAVKSGYALKKASESQS